MGSGSIGKALSEVEPPDDRDWKMRDFVLFDPSGVLWRVAQDID
jgi:uncharacterized glyoxalase superfamily protein PhnB